MGTPGESSFGPQTNMGHTTPCSGGAMSSRQSAHPDSFSISSGKGLTMPSQTTVEVPSLFFAKEKRVEKVTVRRSASIVASTSLACLTSGAGCSRALGGVAGSWPGGEFGALFPAASLSSSGGKTCARGFQTDCGMFSETSLKSIFIKLIIISKHTWM